MRRSFKSSCIQIDILGRRYAAQYNAHVLDWEAYQRITNLPAWEARQYTMIEQMLARP